MANPEHVEILKQGRKVWNKWRRENPKTEPDLMKADLSKADLSRVNLSKANLRQAYLSQTDLRNANLARAHLGAALLTYANLSGANLTSASLAYINFNKANLTGANLTRANLMNTNFSQTILENTNWIFAWMSETILADVDLSQARNLDQTRHTSPSFISFDTIIRSGGKIPEIFLRGCGVSEDIIRYLPSLTNQPIQFYSVFISYTHADKAFARRLHDQLQGRGIRCWLDENQINPGDNIFDEVDRGLKLWDKVLLCCSENSLKHHPWWVDNEINKAFVKEQTLQKQTGKKTLALIPLDLDGYIFHKQNEEYTWNDGKADQVRSRLAADFKGWETNNSLFEAQFERVVKALRTDGGKEPPPPQLLGR